MPTVRKNTKLPYEGSVVLKEHHPTWQYQSVYRDEKPIEK